MAELKYLGRAGYNPKGNNIDRAELTIPPRVLDAYKELNEKDKSD